MDTLEGMRVFTKVVEAKGFSAAARKMGMSKSLVSKYVGQLEERLKVRLMDRTTRGLNLTETGKAYYERSIRLLEDFDELECTISTQHSSPRGQLRLTAPQTFGELYLVPVLEQFMSDYPDISVDLNLSDHFVSLIDEGYDLAIRIADLPDSSLIARRLAPCRLLLSASPKYLEQKGTPQQPKELRDHACILYANSPTPESWSFLVNGKKESVAVQGPIRTNNAIVSRDLGISGFGIVASPYFIVASAIQSGELVPILESFEHSNAAIYAVYPHSRHLSAKVRVFIDYLIPFMKSALVE
ncbi:MAG: LysR family transcriptional regulator [SAR324 cluster bacterium]|uniref:LysR family transcriptional regulator n=1 Tax=SAR324 cluster bacterium TaxID=2024889 RepID=A0A2A4T8F9_9DELT|nr:MAG: LysR family transcriptional regulator [SAR324 cluster bacterium]